MFAHVKFADLPVDDFDRAIAFYVECLGLALVTDEVYGDGSRWAELAVKGAATKIRLFLRSDGADGSEPALILVTSNVKSTYERLRKKGVEFTQAPRRAEWSSRETCAIFLDSEGNQVLISSG